MAPIRKIMVADGNRKPKRLISNMKLPYCKAGGNSKISIICSYFSVKISVFSNIFENHQIFLKFKTENYFKL